MAVNPLGGVLTSFGEPVGLGEALRAAATLELYRNNAFRLAGLPVDATPREVRRRVTEVRAVRALGAGTPQVRGALPLDPPADTEQVEQALSRLREPVGLVVDGFFWFWPAAPGGQPDAGLLALTAGDVERAERAWEAAGTEVAHHNLAVLNHALALDDEHAGKPLPRVGAPPRWRRAYQHWQAVWRSDGCWDVFADRVARLDHPGFGPSTASTFREHLPLMLASISATVAVRNAERGLPDEAVLVHWRLAGHQGYPAGARADAVRAATDSIVVRLQTHVEHAARTAREQPRTAREQPRTAREQPRTARQRRWVIRRTGTPRTAAGAARRLHHQAGPLLRTLALAGAGDADGMHDAVARQMLECALLSHEQTSDWQETLAVLRLAQQVARGSAVRGQIRENVLGVERTLARMRGGGEPYRQPSPNVQVIELRYETPSPEELERMREAAKRRAEENVIQVKPLSPPSPDQLAELEAGRAKWEAVRARFEDYQRRRERGELTADELVVEVRLGLWRLTSQVGERWASPWASRWAEELEQVRRAREALERRRRGEEQE